jgi:Fe-S cluster assembly ATP-binding protein
MLEIKNLHASVDGKEILKGINLTVNKGEVHAIMGPNGSGKSTLAKVLAGHPSYEVTGGEVIYDGKNLLEMSPTSAPAKASSWRSNILWRSRASRMRSFCDWLTTRSRNISARKNWIR